VRIFLLTVFQRHIETAWPSCSPWPAGVHVRRTEQSAGRRYRTHDEADRQWFARHGSTPITELSAHRARRVPPRVEARIALIEKRRDIALMERPECRRCWATDPWEKQQERALREWLQDRLEARHLWFATDRPDPHGR